MKKYISSIVLVLLTLLSSKADASTYTDPQTKVVYTYSVDTGEASVEQCSQNTNNVSGDVTILKEFKLTFSGKTITVTSIESFAFMDNTKITSIVIPNSVRYIDAFSFSGCSNLSSIQVEAGNSRYDSRDNCNAVIETADDALRIGCKNTTIPSSVKEIAGNSFHNCTGLTSITIPSSVVDIHPYAFNNCANLKEVSTVSKHPTFISANSYTFSGIDSNATLTVPKGRKSVYASAQYWKTAFPQIAESNNTTVEEFVYEGNNYRGDYVEQTATLLSASSGAKEYTIPTTTSYEGISYRVVGMADNCLTGDFDMLTIPSDITSIASKALAKCKMKTLVWNAKTALPAAVIDNTTFEKDGNGLLYITTTPATCETLW
ncbi:MAG: leucine-rich repeat domain-containing protein [Prevotella sp.]|nr:leucine-rich repeat domain-containing protein [Prevotella sp.]